LSFPRRRESSLLKTLWITASYPQPPDQDLERQIAVDTRGQIVRHHPAAAREPLLKEPRREGLYNVEQPEQDKAQGHMGRRRINQKEGPLETGNLIDHDALRVLPPEELLRLIRDMPGEAGEGQNRDQPDRPGEDRKEQIQRDADQCSRRPRRQGRKSAPKTRGQEFDKSFVQGAPLFSSGSGREITHTGGKLTSFPPPCQ